MNRFNRLVVVVLIVLTMATCLFALALPDVAVQLARRLAQWFAEWTGGPQVTILDTWSINLGRVLASLIAVLVVLVLGLLLHYEVRRPQTKAVVRVRGTEAEIAPESIRAQVHQRVGGLDDILDASVTVTPVGGKVHIELQVLAAPHVMVAAKVREINRAVRQLVRDNLGLTIAGAPVIHVELASPAAVAHTGEIVSGPTVLGPPKPVPALEEPKSPTVVEAEPSVYREVAPAAEVFTDPPPPVFRPAPPEAAPAWTYEEREAPPAAPPAPPAGDVTAPETPAWAAEIPAVAPETAPPTDDATVPDMPVPAWASDTLVPETPPPESGMAEAPPAADAPAEVSEGEAIPPADTADDTAEEEDKPRRRWRLFG